MLATTGYCGRELFTLGDRPNQLYMVGSMGCVLPLATGLALARPQLKVIALDGDGNLWVANSGNASTGGQATVAPKVSFAEIAAACGYASALETDQARRLGRWLEDDAPGPHFARVFIRPGTPHDLPRPSLSPVEVKNRWQRHFGAIGAA